jgi:hypothetical protein
MQKIKCFLHKYSKIFGVTAVLRKMAAPGGLRGIEKRRKVGYYNR